MHHIERLAVGVERVNDTFMYRGKTYRVIGETSDMTDRLLNDFVYCYEVKDYQTIDNRITGGLLHGWVELVK